MVVSLAGAVTSLRVGKLKGRAATVDGNATKQPRKCGEDGYDDNYDDHQDDEPPTAVADKPLRVSGPWHNGLWGLDPGFKQATA